MKFSLYRERVAKNTVPATEMRQRVGDFPGVKLLNPHAKGRFLLLEVEDERSLRPLKDQVPEGWVLEKNQVQAIPSMRRQGPQPF